MKTKRRFALFLVLAMVIACMGPASFVEAAEKIYIEVLDNKSKIIDLEPGTVTHVKLPVRAKDEFILNPTIVGKSNSEVPFTIGDVTLSTDTAQAEIVGINTYSTTYLEFDITTKDTASIRYYDFYLEVRFERNHFESYENSGVETVICPINLQARITKEKSPAEITISQVVYDEDAAAIGNTFELSFVVANEGEITALNTYATINYGDTGMIPGYTVENIKVGELAPGKTQNIKIPVKVLPTAEDGYKTITVNFTYKDADGELKTSSRSIYITVKKTSTGSSDDAKLLITGNGINDEVLAGADYNLSGTLENIGNKRATNIQVSVVDGIGSTTGIIPKYEGDYITVKSLNSDSQETFSLPLLVTESAGAGLRELTLQVTYNDSEGAQHSAVAKVYVTIVPKATEDVTSDVVITGVSQSPDQPTVGQKVTVTFNIENRGNKEVTDVKVGGENLSSAGFEPFTSQAYKEVGSIKAGEKKTVSLEFKVGSQIAEGLNTLNLGCQYTDISGKKQNNTTSIYILNVMNDSNSKPKVIVSEFTKDSEELKAGSTFLFTYYLKNTHTSKTAKNIKVTITQAENVFSAAQGTNSFYIDKIEAGETIEKSIELKVKSDVTTAAYELQIIVEYEYDDMSKVDIDAGGVTETNKIKLQAVENLRPSVQNFGVGLYGEVPFVYTSTSMFFDFINMGKSSLNNVRFSLEGDFTLETGSSYFHGTISPGSPEYIELMVIPQNEGMCSGTLYITFEDSNGEEVVYPYEFTDINVMGQPTYVDPGFEDPGIPSFEETPVIEQKKAIMPLWVFIVMQVAILAIFIPVVRKIIIVVYKKKLRNKEDNL